jgi:hypothetical protein
MPLVLAFTGFLSNSAVNYQLARAEEPGPLPPAIVTGNSTEICLNSRASIHSGPAGAATDQQIANVLWAAGKAPVIGGYRTIYLTTPNANYIYHPEDHSLEYYSGATVSHAFRMNYERELDFDAGVSYTLALAASVSLWTGTQSQLASCPQQANLNFWITGVPGFTDELVAVSSDSSLPNPEMDRPINLEEIIAGLRLYKKFSDRGDLTPQQISQILWAGYGCTPHWTNNGRGGLTVPSSLARYFLTNRIYVVQDKIWRYCNRVGSDLTTRDHRLELVHEADVREELREALTGIPEAPCYILLCLTEPDLQDWKARIEVGFAAGGMLLQAAALRLGSDFRVPLSTAEQTEIQQITQVPTTDFPHAVVAIGNVTPRAKDPAKLE